jgi:hypothetical protein
MKVLLMKDAQEATVRTLLFLPDGGFETVLATPSGDAASEGIIAEVEPSLVRREVQALRSADLEDAFPGNDVEGSLKELASQLDGYEVGSKVGLHITSRGSTLDFSKATPVNRLGRLRVGDRVVYGAGLAPPYVNARGRVSSIRGELVWVRLDRGDRERIERHKSDWVPECQGLQRRWLEKEDPNELVERLVRRYRRLKSRFVR